MTNNALPAVTSPDAPGRAEDENTYASMVCSAEGRTACLRRVEWRITARDHDGAVLCTYYACNDTQHRGMASALAWRIEPAKVEVRQYGECG
jgi:hypothetical protein